MSILINWNNHHLTLVLSSSFSRCLSERRRKKMPRLKAAPLGTRKKGIHQEGKASKMVDRLTSINWNRMYEPHWKSNTLTIIKKWPNLTTTTIWGDNSINPNKNSRRKSLIGPVTTTWSHKRKGHAWHRNYRRKKHPFATLLIISRPRRVSAVQRGPK